MNLIRIVLLIPLATLYLAYSVIQVLPKLSRANEFAEAMGYLLIPTVIFAVVVFGGRRRGTSHNPPADKK